MADLPVPDPQLVTAQMPQDRVSAGDVQRSGDYVAQGLSSLSAGLDQLAVPIAEQAGRDAAANAVVTRDANGNPIVQPPGGAFIMGAAGSAYDHAQAAGLYAKGQTATSLAMNNLHLQHQGDPQGFANAAQSYYDNLKATWGNTQVGETMLANAQEMGAQHYIRLTDDKAANDVAGSKSDLLTQVDDQKSNLIAIARQGQIGSPQFQDGLGKLNALYSSLGSNPLFHIPQGVIDSEIAHSNSTFKAEAMIGTLDATVNKSGKAAGQQFLTDKVLNNPDLMLSDPERKSLYAYGMNHLEFLSGANKAQIAATRSAVDQVETQFKAGQSIPDTMLDGFDQAARANGDDETHLRIAAMRANGAIRGQDGLTPSQSLQQQFPQGMPGPAGAATPAYLSKLFSIEDPSGDPNAVSPTGAKGLGQFTSGTWDRYGNGGNPFNPSDNVAATVRLTNANAVTMTNSLGRAPTPGELYLAHQQGPAGAAALLANPGANAVQALSLAYNGNVAKAATAITVNGGNINMTAGQFASKWTSRFDGAGGVPAGATVPTAPGTMPWTAPQIAANPFLGSIWTTLQAHDQSNREALAEKIGGTIEQGLKLGQPPSQDGLTSFLQIANSNPAKFGDQMSRIGVAMAGTQLATQADNAPGGGGQALIDRYRQDAAQRQDVYSLRVAEAGQQKHDATTAALKSDPMGEAVRHGWAQTIPPDLNPNDPSTFGPAIAARGAVAQSIAARTGDPDQPALGQADVPAVKALLSQGLTDQKLALLDPWSKLPQAVQAATFRTVGLNDSDAQTFAAAGSVYKTDPQVARDILDGHTLQKQDARLAPKTSDRDAAISTSMPANDFGPGITSTVMNAAQALYAKSSAVAGDTSQVLNQSRWDDAVSKVTGGVVNWRGSNIIVPKPGMTDGDFRDRMKGLTDADLAGSRTADGTPLPPSALQPTFFGNSSGYRLQSFADGKYLVFSGDTAARSYLRDASGAPFVLDLGKPGAR